MIVVAEGGTGNGPDQPNRPSWARSWPTTTADGWLAPPPPSTTVSVDRFAPHPPCSASSPAVDQ